MRSVTVVNFQSKSAASPQHIVAIRAIEAGQFYIHFHDPAHFKTPFHRWFTQLKKRYQMTHLKSSMWAEVDGVLQNGKNGTSRVKNPDNCFTIWYPPDPS